MLECGIIMEDIYMKLLDYDSEELILFIQMI